MTGSGWLLGKVEICKLMTCKSSKAYDYIKVIKEVSDNSKIQGRVTLKDFCLWQFGVVTEDLIKKVLKKLEE